MFCVECGKEIRDDASFCPFCGAQVPEVAADGDEPLEDNSPETLGEPGVEETPLEEGDAQPISQEQAEQPNVVLNDGESIAQGDTWQDTPLEETKVMNLTEAATDADAQGAQSGTSPEDGDGRKTMDTRTAVAIAAGVVIVLAVTIVVFIKTGVIRRGVEVSSADEPTEVAFAVQADGYSDTTSTAIPVHITGKDKDGKKVDETQYVNAEGRGVSVRDGSYTFSFPASPANHDGTYYRAPSYTYQVKVKNGSVTTTQVAADGTKGKEGSSVTVALQNVEQSEVTEDEKKAADKYARDAPDPASLSETKAKAQEDSSDSTGLAEAAANNNGDNNDKSESAAAQGTGYEPLASIASYDGTTYVSSWYDEIAIDGATDVPDVNNQSPSWYGFEGGKYIALSAGNGGFGYLTVSNGISSEGTEVSDNVNTLEYGYSVGICDGALYYQELGADGSGNDLIAYNIATGKKVTLCAAGCDAYPIGIGDGCLYYATSDYQNGSAVYSVSLEGGEPKKLLDLGDLDRAVYASDEVILVQRADTNSGVVPSGSLVAYDNSGSVKWSLDGVSCSQAEDGSPVVKGDTVYCVDAKTAVLHRVDLSSGKDDPLKLSDSEVAPEVLMALDGNDVYVKVGYIANSESFYASMPKVGDSYSTDIYKIDIESGSVTKAGTITRVYG